MVRIQRLYLLLCILVFTNACRKDQTETTIIDIDSIETIQQIEAIILGRIIDDNGEALPEVSIRMGSTNVFSNIHGDFIISDFINEKRALIHVQKEGYFDAFPVFNPSDKGEISVNVHLKEKTSSQTLNTNQGGNLVISDDFSIDFQANSLSSYPIVEVSGYYIDPTDSDASKIMPGNLSGLTTDNEEVHIISYGIGRFEFEETGEATLTQAATISIAIPPSLSNNAPTSLSLWHFDKTEGIWVEKGIAQRQGSFYIGEISQSGIWTTAIPADIIRLGGRLLQNITTSLQLRISRTSDDASNNYFTDINGYFSGFVFKDERLLLEVLNACGDIISQEDLGPFSSDTQIGDIVIPTFPPSENQINIRGTLWDCGSEPVPSGSIGYILNDVIHILTTDENGRFQSTISLCNEDDEVRVFGFDNQVIGSSLNYSPDLPFLLHLCEALSVDRGFGYYLSIDGEAWPIGTASLEQGPYEMENNRFGFDFVISDLIISDVSIELSIQCQAAIVGTYLIEEITILETKNDVISSESSLIVEGVVAKVENGEDFTVVNIYGFPLHRMIEGNNFTGLGYGQFVVTIDSP